MTADPYLYRGTNTLRNKLGIRDEAALDRMERQLVLQRARESAPPGNFDLNHLCAIHRHLFQDVYDWAGKLRTVEIAKEGHQFQFRQYIQTGMADVHRRLESAAFLRGLSARDFAEQAGPILGDVNYIHPFREGNGRTQLLYLDQIAAQAGHPVDLTRLRAAGWMAASRSAHRGDYGAMSGEIFRALAARKAT